MELISLQTGALAYLDLAVRHGRLVAARAALDQGRRHRAALLLRLGLDGNGVADATVGAVAGAFLLMGLAAYRGVLPTGRPIVRGS